MAAVIMLLIIDSRIHLGLSDGIFTRLTSMQFAKDFAESQLVCQIVPSSIATGGSKQGHSVLG